MQISTWTFQDFGSQISERFVGNTARWLSWLKRLTSNEEIPSSNLGRAFLFERNIIFLDNSLLSIDVSFINNSSYGWYHKAISGPWNMVFESFHFCALSPRVLSST